MTDEPSPAGVLLRYLRRNYDLTELTTHLRSYVLCEDAGPSENHFPVFHHRIVIATLDLTIMDIANTMEVYQPAQKPAGMPVFDVVCVDEAASIDFPRMALVLSLAAHGQVLLAGDSKQLPAYITSEAVKRAAGDESAMEFLERLMPASRPTRPLSLSNNYRSREEIVEASNAKIYASNPLQPINHSALCQKILISPDTFQSAMFQVLPGVTHLTEQEKHIPYGVAFHHVEGYQEKWGTNYMNPCEAAIVCQTVHHLTGACGIASAAIGVDCTYAALASLLKQMLSDYPEIKIGCSSTWQGNERDFMVISLVRSEPGHDALANYRPIGFLEDLRRLNVSITRARFANIFVGNGLRFIHHPLMRECLSQCCRNNSWVLPSIAATQFYVHYLVCESGPTESPISVSAETFADRLKNPFSFFANNPPPIFLPKKQELPAFSS